MPVEPEQLNIQEQIQRYLQKVRERWYTIAVVTIIALLVGVGLAQLWPDQYEAATLFSLKESQLVEESTLEKSLKKVRLAAQRQTLTKELRSESRMREVLKALEWKEYIRAQMDPTGRDLAAFYQKVRDGIRVEIQGDTLGETFVTLTFTWNNPRKAAEYVNAMRDLWIDLRIVRYQEGYIDKMDRAEVVIRERKAVFDKALRDLEEFDRENNYAALGILEENNRLKMNLLEQITQDRASVKSLDKRISELQKDLSGLEPTMDVSKKIRNKEYVKLELQYKKALDRYLAGKEKWREAHSDLTKLRVAAEALKDQLDAMKDQEFVVDGIEGKPNPVYHVKNEELTRIRTQYGLAKERLKSSETQLEAIDENLHKLPMITAERDGLLGNIEVAETQYHDARIEAQPIQDRVNSFQSIRQRGGVYETEATFRNEAFEVLTYAAPRPEPTNPMTVIILTISFFVGLSLGFLIVLLGEVVKSSFSTREEVALYLKLPVLGVVSRIMTEAEINTLKWRKVIFTSSTLLVVFCLVAILFICNQYPQLIPPAIVEKVNQIREALG